MDAEARHGNLSALCVNHKMTTAGGVDVDGTYCYCATDYCNDVIGEFPLGHLEESWWMAHKCRFLIVCVCVGLVVLVSGLAGVAVYRRRITWCRCSVTFCVARDLRMLSNSQSLHHRGRVNTLKCYWLIQRWRQPASYSDSRSLYVSW